MPTRTVRLYADDVDQVEELAELDPDASFAAKAHDVLRRVREGDAVRVAVREELERRGL